MAALGFKKFLEKVFLEEDQTPGTEQVPTEEEMQTFEAAITSEGGDDVKTMAQAIIIDSQAPYEDDDLANISNVEDALQTAGADAPKDLVLRILSYGGFIPADLEQDGLNRRQAIVDAITRIQQQDSALKQSKAAEATEISQAESAAETACTTAITDANRACEEAIAEEKRRSEEIIKGIRQKAEEDTAAAKALRDETLSTLAAQRADNEAALKQSAALVAETEAQGHLVIAKLDELLGYLK